MNTAIELAPSPAAPGRAAAAVRALKRRALAHYSPIILPEIKRLLEKDISFAKIAKYLNEAGHRNGRGNEFSPSLVHFLAKSAGLIVT